MYVYAYIANKMKSLKKFKAALEKLGTEDGLSKKVRLWVHLVANNTEGIGRTFNHIPVWIEQITDDNAEE